MKIIFASGSMQGGGAERVVSILANEFVARGIEVTVLVVRGQSVYELDDRVRLVSLFREEEFTSSLFNKVSRRLVYLSRLLERVSNEGVDLIIPVHGGGWNGMFVLLARLLGVRVIAAEHTNHTVGRFRLTRWIEQRVIYRLADALTVLTAMDLSHYSSYLSNVHLLPNPVSFSGDGQRSQRKKVILAAGRLNSWFSKGFDSLLTVFAELAPHHPEWRLEIAGTGDEGKLHLEKLSERFGISRKVKFLGFRDDLDRVMGESEIFILTSRFEGFPLVLAEAMTQGCACVSYNCNAGPSDIIENDVDGLLVPDQDHAAMVGALQRLIVDECLRDRLSGAAVEAAKRYAPGEITDRWIALFRSLGLSC